MASHGGQVGSVPSQDDSPDLRSVPLLNNGLEAPVLLPSAPTGIGLKRSSVKSADVVLNKSHESITTKGWGLRKEWTAATTSWIVKAEDLEPLPAGFPLEKTHCKIEEDATVVSERIAGTLRSLSIDSKYCSKSAKVSCQTDDCVRFKIHLFAGGSDGQPVIVEVQKCCGPAFLFARTCRVLLNAARGKVLTPSKPFMKPMSLPPLCKMKCLQGAMKEETSHSDAKEQVQSVQRMLSSERSDERWLAIENLCCLTDPVKTSAAVSKEISAAFLKDATLRNAVLLMLSPTDRAAGDNYESFNRVSYPTKHLPLMAFGNALEQLRSDGSLAELIAADSWFSGDFVPQLLDQIGRDGQFCVSYHGNRCLLALLVCCGTVQDSEVAKVIVSAGGIELLREVHERSGVYHQRLEHGTKLCLDFLQGGNNDGDEFA